MASTSNVYCRAKSCYLACEPFLSICLQYSHSDLAVHDRPDNPNAQALRTVVFYLYTGFIIDLSLLDTKTMTSTEASRVEQSYDAYELYKIAEFLDIEPLTELLVSRGINIFGPRCSPNDCRQQLASLLFRAQVRAPPCPIRVPYRLDCTDI